MPEALTGVDWNAIRHDREVMGLSYTELEQRHGVKWATIAQRSKRESWRHSLTRQASKVANAALKDSNKLIHSRTAEKVAEKASTMLAGEIGELVSSAFKKSRELMEKSHAMAMATESATDLKNATIAFGIAHQHGRLALGMDRPDGGIKSPWAAMQQAAVQAGPVIDVEAVVPRGTVDKPIESAPLATAVHPSG